MADDSDVLISCRSTVISADLVVAIVFLAFSSPLPSPPSTDPSLWTESSPSTWQSNGTFTQKITSSRRKPTSPFLFPVSSTSPSVQSQADRRPSPGSTHSPLLRPSCVTSAHPRSRFGSIMSSANPSPFFPPSGLGPHPPGLGSGASALWIAAGCTSITLEMACCTRTITASHPRTCRDVLRLPCPSLGPSPNGQVGTAR